MHDIDFAVMREGMDASDETVRRFSESADLRHGKSPWVAVCDADR
jgi:hypothetical protein